MSKKEKITCGDCGADFELKYNDEEHDPSYCPFCGADLFWEEGDDEDEEDYEWSDPDNDEYS